jgi:very-short-patch-repair endonuclease
VAGEGESSEGFAIRNLRCIDRVAGDQNSVITTAQLMNCGCSKAMISRRVAQLRLYPKHRGVYAVGRADLSPAGVCHAAALAVGEDAVVSHRAAGLLDGFWPREIEAVDITVARRGPRDRLGIRIHRVTELPRSDWRWCQGMRVTTADRTILDLAATLRSDHVFRRTVHEALVQRRVSEHALRKAIDTHPGHPGANRLAGEIKDGAKPTRSGFEDWGVQLLRRYDFPAFKTNVHPAGTPSWVEVDIYFSEQRLVIEIDGDRYHQTPYRRERDAKKQALLEAAGLKVLRLTDEDAEPQQEARTVKRIQTALI